jgi:hypothetical protein
VAAGCSPRCRTEAVRQPVDGSDIVYVARVSVPKLIALRVEIGTRFPAVQTSQGKVLLAALSPDELEATLAEPSRPGCRPTSAGSAEQLRDELTEVRARGWALADEELAPGVRSVAVPVRDGTAPVRAAMNVTVHAAETSPSGCCTSTCRCCCAPPATSAPSGRCGSPARTSSRLRVTIQGGGPEGDLLVRRVRRGVDQDDVQPTAVHEAQTSAASPGCAARRRPDSGSAATSAVPG